MLIDYKRALLALVLVSAALLLVRSSSAAEDGNADDTAKADKVVLRVQS